MRKFLLLSLLFSASCKSERAECLYHMHKEEHSKNCKAFRLIKVEPQQQNNTLEEKAK